MVHTLFVSGRCSLLLLQTSDQVLDDFAHLRERVGTHPLRQQLETRCANALLTVQQTAFRDDEFPQISTWPHFDETEHEELRFGI